MARHTPFPCKRRVEQWYGENEALLRLLYISVEPTIDDIYPDYSIPLGIAIFSV